MGIRERWGDLDAVRLDEFVPDAHTDIPRLRRGGVDVQFWAAYVPPRFRGSEATVVADQQIDLIHELTRRYPSDLELATSWSDVERARAAKKVASMIGVEGGHAIDESLDVLKEFYQRGARYLTLTHNRSLAWADAAGDQPRAGGLSAFGREVVAMMNELGMLVDLSHVTTRTMHDAIEVSAAPVIFSHSSARALVDHPRNVPDEVLARVPQNGGVVMVNFFSGFLTLEGAASVPGLFEAEEEIREAQAEPEGYRTEMEAWLEALAGTRGTVGTIADHIDHIAQIAGPAHVGLGSDFDGMPMSPIGMDDVSCYPALTVELVRRGYSDDEVRGVLGENFLRVLRRADGASGTIDCEII